MRVHLLGLPHTWMDGGFDTCAFTAKQRKLVAMLEATGHDAIVYESTPEQRTRWFGDEDWRDRVFDRWDATDPCWSEFCADLARRVGEQAEPGDVLSLTMGLAHKPVADALPHLLAVELGIGYEGSFADHRVFESQVWMHHTMGRQGIHDGRWYWDVIPNPVDPDEFHEPRPHDGYLLFLGRHIPRKGLAVVEELAKHHVVVTAGQGDLRVPGAEYAGIVRGKERADLLAGARCLLAPTGYIEPWGGVSVEAQASGVPVLASPWGGFTENIIHGSTGYLCHTLGEFLAAVDASDDLDRDAIRASALARYSLDAVAPLYDRYLARLATLHGDGWYTLADT